MARTQTLVQLTQPLLDLLDARAAREGVSRSLVIRRAVEAYLRVEREEQISQAIIKGYARQPQAGPDVDDWGDLGAQAEQAARELAKALDAEERAAGLEPW